MPRFNLPTVERLVRLLLGLGLAAYAWLAPDEPNAIFVAIGLCVALTGLVGFCPACALAGRRLKPRS
ncbi:MAG: YgaP-like transmembrane domain [Sphingosinicella sp.]|uniref:YgaP-like transmembrane domain n=1 Tax=Sphingosinicella sp. TaxID=1917971 RepID=UPI0040380668